MIRKMMLVSDRSESAERAVQVAGELATTFGAEVLVIYVMMPLPVWVKMAGEANDRFIRRERQRAGQPMRNLFRHGGRLSVPGYRQPNLAA